MGSEYTPHIGLVTGSSVPGLTEDGQAVEQKLSDRGYEVSGVVWSTSEVDWSSFDAIVVRSCWEYYRRAEQFRTWLRSVEEQVQQVINPASILEWNMHKSYLNELDADGVTMTPTVCVEQGANESLQEICERENWDHVVIKPAIGTSSDGVWKATVPVSTDANERFRAAVAEQDLLVQEFVPEITSGELSMVFFEGEYSHANCTVPEASDFRAHYSFGASSKSVTPSETVREEGIAVLESVGGIHGIDPSDLAYARVDGVERDGLLVLLELELIEPYLSLSASEGAVDRFVDAIERTLPVHHNIVGEL